MKAELLYRCDDITGEAATWLPERQLVLWVNIDKGILHTMDYASGRVVHQSFPDMITALIPVADHPDELLIAMKDRFVVYSLDTYRHGEVALIPDLPSDMRTNDAKAAPDGTLWYGLMNMRQQNHNGYLCQMQGDLRQRRVLHGQSIPNGIVWRADRMYYADSGRSCIEAYLYDSLHGDISLLHTAVNVPEGMGIPDGMTIDADGNLWVAHWGGAMVGVWNPDTGGLIDRVEVPAPNVASCTFGGPDGQDLFITTARSGLTSEELLRYPLSGSLFVAHTGHKGAQNHYPFKMEHT